MIDVRTGDCRELVDIRHTRGYSYRMPNCECGCGQPVKGRYRRPKVGGWRTQRFVSPAHSLRVNRAQPDWTGRHHTDEAKRKIGAATAARATSITPAAGRAKAVRIHKRKPCLVCQAPAERHHIDGETHNNTALNIVFLCRPHHRRIHPGNGPRPLRPLSELIPEDSQ